MNIYTKDITVKKIKSFWLFRKGLGRKRVEFHKSNSNIKTCKHLSR